MPVRLGQLPHKLTRAKQANQPDHDQIDRHDGRQQARDDENQDAGDERYDRDQV